MPVEIEAAPGLGGGYRSRRWGGRASTHTGSAAHICHGSGGSTSSSSLRGVRMAELVGVVMPGRGGRRRGRGASATDSEPAQHLGDVGGGLGRPKGGGRGTAEMWKGILNVGRGLM